jgi:hypothetical protein
MGNLIDGIHGAFLRTDVAAQLGAYGTRRALRDGSLRPLWPRVLVESRRWADPLTRGSAALLSLGPRAVLCGATAAQLHGCSAMATPQIHVVVPYEHYARPQRGLVVHNGVFYRDDVEEIDGLRVLALDRVVTDLLCGSGSGDALAVADQALARQPEGERDRYRARIGNRIDTRRDRRGTIRGRELLALATGRAESPPESWLMLILVELGFPHPEANWPIRSPSGREIYRLDLAWPDLRIAVEYDGHAVHTERVAEDEARDDDLRRRGWIVVHVTAEGLADRGDLAARLRAAFRERGYTW